MYSYEMNEAQKAWAKFFEAMERNRVRPKIQRKIARMLLSNYEENVRLAEERGISVLYCSMSDYYWVSTQYDLYGTDYQEIEPFSSEKEIRMYIIRNLGDVFNYKQ